MGTCINCGESSPVISEPLSVCLSCIRDDFERLEGHIKDVHVRLRQRYGLPGEVPKGGAARCNFCVNECEVESGGLGFCGIRKEVDGKLKFRSGSPKLAYVDYYYDRLPTNCVADWVCPGKTMRGKNNLAVFYRACSFDCLFCQNFTFRLTNFDGAATLSDIELASRATRDTGCICYFGGDPTPQIAHSLATSKAALKRGAFRICWETNGSMSIAHLDKITEVALQSGGIIKFDLKTHDENLSLALCGTTNRRTLDNFAHLASRLNERRDPPLMVASTLLVPGYIDVLEVREISRFVSSLDRGIPYSLLGFHPHCNMSDLPTTSREHAARAREVAVEAGLENVHIGNVHLLSYTDYPV
ncbi:MAG: radical SAM protein [bacterium]